MNFIAPPPKKKTIISLSLRVINSEIILYRFAFISVSMVFRFFACQKIVSKGKPLTVPTWLKLRTSLSSKESVKDKRKVATRVLQGGSQASPELPKTLWTSLNFPRRSLATSPHKGFHSWPTKTPLETAKDSTADPLRRPLRCPLRRPLRRGTA